MSNRLGTPKGAVLGSPIVKQNDSDKKGSHYAYQGIGGWLPVIDEADRNAITVDTKLNEDGYSSGQRELGMAVYYMTGESFQAFRLRIAGWEDLTASQKISALSDNDNWEPIEFSGEPGLSAFEWWKVYNGTPDATEEEYLAAIKGDPGANGANGAAATISVGTVQTGAAGTSVQVTNSGTPNAAILNITIPKGDPGENSDVEYATESEEIDGTSILKASTPGGRTAWWNNIIANVITFAENISFTKAWYANWVTGTLPLSEDKVLIVNKTTRQVNAISPGTAFNKNTGTTAGTLAAGDDSRIVNAMQKIAQVIGDAGKALVADGLGGHILAAITATAGGSVEGAMQFRNALGQMAGTNLLKWLETTRTLVIGASGNPATLDIDNVESSVTAKSGQTLRFVINPGLATAFEIVDQNGEPYLLVSTTVGGERVTQLPAARFDGGVNAPADSRQMRAESVPVATKTYLKRKDGVDLTIPITLGTLKLSGTAIGHNASVGRSCTIEFFITFHHNGSSCVRHQTTDADCKRSTTPSTAGNNAIVVAAEYAAGEVKMYVNGTDEVMDWVCDLDYIKY